MARRFVQRRQRDLHGLGTSSGMQVLQEKKWKHFLVDVTYRLFCNPKNHQTTKRLLMAVETYSFDKRKNINKRLM
jgi:hypothetical protein